LPATIVGTPGPDVLAGTDGLDVIVALAGDDRIDGRGGNDRICADDGNDTVVGGPGADAVFGAGGNDMILGSDGDDLLFGEAGNDSITAGPGTLDGVVGGPGDDTLTGDEFDLVAFYDSPRGVQIFLKTGRATGNGNDQLRGFENVAGSNFDDTLVGTDDGNAMFGQGGNDVIQGEGGFDVALFGAGPVRVDLVTGLATGEGSDRLVDVEGLFGSQANDVLLGDGHDNYIGGYGGDDVLQGRDGADRLVGDAGNDQIDGGDGNDILLGYPGDDTLVGGAGANDGISFRRSATGVDVDLERGTATGEGSDRVSGAEAISGSDFADRLAGNALANSLRGNAGDDVLDGRAGPDFLDGGAGADNAAGGDGEDYCVEAERSSSCELGGGTGRFVFTNAGSASTTSTAPRITSPSVRGLASAIQALCRSGACPVRDAAQPWLAPLAVLAANPLSGLTESHTQPTCAPGRRRGTTSIGAPTWVKPLNNETVRWRATLFRLVGRRAKAIAKTPFVDGAVVGTGVEDGYPNAWYDRKRHVFDGRTKRLTRPGRYYWTETVTWKQTRYTATGRATPLHQPPGSAAGKPYCVITS
jgi:Ca2+-binding RTX toxin-like protein